MDSRKKLERAIVWLLANGAKKKGLTQAEFARRALPTHKSPESTWSQVRTGGKDGEYRKLQFTEMIALSEMIGEDLQQLIFRGRAMLADGWTEEKAGSPLK